MKTKLLTAFFIGCSLLIGSAVFIDSETFSNSENEIAYSDTNQELISKSSEKRKSITSFFEIFSDQKSLAVNNPDLYITNTPGLGGYNQVTQNGVTTFLRCTSDLSNDGAFDFKDPNQSTYPSGTSYFINWGDGNTSTQVKPYTYSSGLYTLSYTVTFPDGTTNTSEFKVFVGTGPPTISVSLSSEENCFPEPFSYTVTTGKNIPGTTYTIEISDGSAPIVLNSDDYPYGVPITQTFTHKFSKTSCGVTSGVGLNKFTDSFAITVNATNPCNVTGNATATGPIRVSEPAEANFNLPAEIACVNSLVNFTDTSFGGTNTTQSGCSGDYGRYWKISPVGGTTIAGGLLGNDNGNATDWFSWVDGSEVLGVIFDTPGYYDITLVTRNNCGETELKQQICIIPEVISEFTISQDEACFEDNQIVSTTNISQADGCNITPEYTWTVSQDNPDCPPTISPGWQFANGTGANDLEPKFSFTSPGVYTIRLEVFVQSILPGENCRDDVFERVVTIKDKPKAELDDLVVCQDEPFNIDPKVYDCYSSSGTSYYWDFGSNPPASISTSTNPNPSISYSTPGDYTYELTVSNIDCGANTYTGNIKVLPPVNIQADGPTDVCVGEDIQLKGVISGGTGKGKWKANPPVGSFSPNAKDEEPIYTPPSGFTGEIKFTLSSDNKGTLCDKVTDTHTVKVLAGPEVDAGSYNPICIDSNITLNATISGSATSVTWSSPSGGTFSDPTDPNSTFTPPIGFTGTLTLEIITDDPAGSCPAASDSVDLKILPLGEVNPIPDLTLCSTDTTSEIVFSSPNVINTTSFEWKIDTDIGLTPLTGTGNLPSFTAKNSTQNPIIATVTVTPFVTKGGSSCEGNPKTFTITVDPAPVVLDANIDLCSGDAFDFTPNSSAGNFVPSGTTYIWDTPVSSPSGAVIGGSSENTPQTSISQAIENSTKEAASLTYTITPILGGCEGTPFTLTVNFPEEPVIQDIDVEVCSGEAFSVEPDENFSGNQIPAGTKYTWVLPTINPAGSVTGATAQSSPVSSIDQVLVNTSSTISTVTYQVTPEYNGCEGEPFKLTIDVKPEPFISDYDLNICSGETFTISPDDILPNRVPNLTKYTWGLPTLSQPGTITGISEATSPQSEINQTLVNNSNEDVIVTYEVFPISDACVGDPFYITVVVEPKPLISDISESICTGGTFSITPANTGGNIIPVNTTYTWSDPVSTPAGAITGGYAETNPQTEINQSVTNTSENIATLTYTVTPESGNCIGDPFTVEIVVESSGQIQEEPIALQSICEGGQILPLSVSLESGESLSTTYQWYKNTTPTNSGGTVIPGATNSTYLPTAFNTTGSYYFYVIVSPEGDQCGDVISQVSKVEVVEDPSITSQQLDDQELCLNSMADELSVVLSGGIGQFNYQWYVNNTPDTSTGTAIANETGANFTPPSDQVGTLYYYVKVSQNASGCETTSEISKITVAPQPLINQQPQSEELCLDATPDLLSVNINFNLGNPSYQWFENDTNDNFGGTAIAGETQPIFLPSTTVAGDRFYYVEINFDNSSCGPLVSDPAVITSVPYAELNPITNLEVCLGDEVSGIDFTTTNPAMISSFSWTNSNTEIGLASSGSGYLPTFTATNTTDVTQAAVITVTSESTFSGDDCGKSTTEFEITVPSEIVDNAIISDFNGNQTSCFDANDGSIEISPSGGIPRSNSQPYLFNWSGPNGFSSNQEDIYNLKPGTYNLEITDGYGCNYNFSYEIESPEELIIKEDAVLNIQCHGAFTGEILISLSGGTGNYSYNWLKNGKLVATTQDLVNIGAGYYTVIVKDGNNCTAVEDFEVTEPSPITIDVLEKSALVCTPNISIPKSDNSKALGDEFNGFVTIEVQGGSPLQTGPNEFTYQYEWKNAVDDIISTEKNLTGVGPGFYSVDVYDNLTCVASKDVELILPDPIAIKINKSDESCAFNEDGKISLDIEGGTTPYAIKWNTGETGNTLENLAPGIYTAEITDKYNCNEVVTVEVKGVNPLGASYDAQNITCAGASDGYIDVNVEGGRKLASGSYDYQWTGPDGFKSSEPVLDNLEAGVYTLKVRDASGCEVTIVEEITEPQPLSVTYETTLVHCFGIDDGTITLFVEGGTAPYTSNFGPGGSTFLFEALEPGIYDIEVMDDNGCMKILEIEIENEFINHIDPPTGDQNQEFCIEDQPTVSDLDVSGMDIKWYLSPTDEDALDDDYLITASTTLYARNYDNALNCLSSGVLEVEVNIIQGILDVNNFITVNGNNLNDKLNVVNIDLFPDNEMKIYNRYGKLVWETTGYNNTDNAFRGASNVGGTVNQTNFLPTGTYFYILNYKSPCKNDTKKGFVQIDNNNR